MTVVEIPGTPLDPSPTDGCPRQWKWTGDDLIRMGEAGLLPPEGRFELLDGEIYQLMPPGTLHTFIVNLIQGLLQVVRAHGAFIQVQNPIRLSENYDPQPDIAVVRGREYDYRDRFPGPEDVLLVIEVCDSSVEHDRVRKVPAYAGAGIRECWLVNLPEQRVEVYHEPIAGEYRALRLYRSGETMSPLAFPEITLSAADLLGEEGSES